MDNSRCRRATALVAALCLVFAGIAAAQPVVGLVYTTAQYERLERSGKDDLRLYRAAIEENGGRVAVIAQSFEKEALNTTLAAADAILLPGGIDVDPKFYGEERHEKLEETDAALDEAEFKALAYAAAHGLPVLGICRGHQVMNVHFGGTLIQDIPSHFGGKPEVVHRFPKGSRAPREHAIRIEAGTMLHEILGATTLTVNTYHHQAVARLADDFVATAWSEDGVVEAMESKGEPFMVGVQFHPERLREKDARFNALFVRFLSEAEKARGSGTSPPRSAGSLVPVPHPAPE